ncbi:MAG: hypothetical protein PHD81_00010 [Candidatus Nanoarchaeia archaeon]|nr:hypothetical protein [Candidatus Nanoarchaeia archaeon]MDD5587477.1 hypothetical protein [Candidatus Nanoarchaeia archaeon]
MAVEPEKKDNLPVPVSKPGEVNFNVEEIPIDHSEEDEVYKNAKARADKADEDRIKDASKNINPEINPSAEVPKAPENLEEKVDDISMSPIQPRGCWYRIKKTGVIAAMLLSLTLGGYEACTHLGGCAPIGSYLPSKDKQEENYQGELKEAPIAPMPAQELTVPSITANYPAPMQGPVQPVQGPVQPVLAQAPQETEKPKQEVKQHKKKIIKTKDGKYIFRHNKPLYAAERGIASVSCVDNGYAIELNKNLSNSEFSELEAALIDMNTFNVLEETKQEIKDGKAYISLANYSGQENLRVGIIGKDSNGKEYVLSSVGKYNASKCVKTSEQKEEKIEEKNIVPVSKEEPKPTVQDDSTVLAPEKEARERQAEENAQKPVQEQSQSTQNDTTNASDEYNIKLATKPFIGDFQEIDLNDAQSKYATRDAADNRTELFRNYQNYHVLAPKETEEVRLCNLDKVGGLTDCKKLKKGIGRDSFRFKIKNASDVVIEAKIEDDIDRLYLLTGRVENVFIKINDKTKTLEEAVDKKTGKLDLGNVGSFDNITVSMSGYNATHETEELTIKYMKNSEWQYSTFEMKDGITLEEIKSRILTFSPDADTPVFIHYMGHSIPVELGGKLEVCGANKKGAENKCPENKNDNYATPQNPSTKQTPQKKDKNVSNPNTKNTNKTNTPTTNPQNNSTNPFIPEDETQKDNSAKKTESPKIGISAAGLFINGNSNIKENGGSDDYKINGWETRLNGKVELTDNSSLAAQFTYGQQDESSENVKLRKKPFSVGGFYKGEFANLLEGTEIFAGYVYKESPLDIKVYDQKITQKVNTNEVVGYVNAQVVNVGPGTVGAYAGVVYDDTNINQKDEMNNETYNKKMSQFSTVAGLSSEFKDPAIKSSLGWEQYTENVDWTNNKILTGNNIVGTFEWSLKNKDLVTKNILRAYGSYPIDGELQKTVLGIEDSFSLLPDWYVKVFADWNQKEWVYPSTNTTYNKEGFELGAAIVLGNPIKPLQIERLLH